MTHQDSTEDRKDLEFLKQVFEQYLPSEIEEVSRHGNSTLGPRWLAAVAVVCWGWTRAEATLDRRIDQARSAVNNAFGGQTTATRQGIMNALGSMGDELVHRVLAGFTEQVKNLKGLWSSGGKVNIAVDGSKYLAPRTKQNQQAFCKLTSKSSNASKKASVQMLTTLFWHMGTGLPLLWKIAGSSGSERNDARSAVDQLPPNTRLIGDAAYVGYPLWSTLMDSGRTFLFRVGSNIRLLKNLGPMKFKDGYVYMWSDKAMKKKQKPLVLKLIKIHNGKKAIYLVTNELDMPESLAGELYRQRWGIEVFFRGIKQTYGKRKLICGSPRNVVTELNWTLLGIWLAQMVGKQQLKENQTDVRQLSPVKVLRTFYNAISRIALMGKTPPTLSEALSYAVILDEENRTSSKQNRMYPIKKKHKRCGPPDLIQATAKQKNHAQFFFP